MLAAFRNRVFHSLTPGVSHLKQQDAVEIFMNQYRIAFVAMISLLLVLPANAEVKNGSIRITVLDSETHSVTLDGSGVPKNCDGVNFDAYCLNSKTSEVTNTLLVQEGDRPPYRVSCNVDTKWSRCMPLERGTSYDARREKRGLLVYFVDDNGKLRKQLYTMAAPEAGDGAKGATPATASVAAATPVTRESSQIAAQAIGTDSVKCSFSSTPLGAEVSVDGRYVGSTPSVLSLNVGNHSVEVSLPGFAQWKRQLTVSVGSELSVNAVLQKGQ